MSLDKKNYIIIIIGVILVAAIGYYIYINMFAYKDPSLQIKIIQGANHQNMYDEEFTSTYNYTYLLDKEKQVWFNDSPMEDDYSKNGTLTETRLYTFQNVSEVNAWLDSIMMPNVVKGVAKTMMNMSIAEVFRVIEKQPQPLYDILIENLLGNKENYHYSVGRGRQRNGLEVFSLSFENSVQNNVIWRINISKADADLSYSASIVLYPK